MKIDISNKDLYANDNFAKLMSIRSRILISYGSRDAGKSLNIAQKIVYNLLSEKYCKVVLLRKIYADIKDTQYLEIKNIISNWNLDDYFVCTVSPLAIKCLINTNSLIARGLDRETKLKSIVNPSIVWIEEADEITEKDFETIDWSVRSNIPGALKQIILTFNPDKSRSWINKAFFPPASSYEKEDGLFSWVKSIQKNVIILHSNYLTNKYCSKENKERYLSVKFSNYKTYKTSGLGLWGSVNEALVFKNYYIKDEFPTEYERKFYGIGLDFGFTNHPSVAVECCIAHGEIYVRELFYKTGLVNIANIEGRPSIETEFIRCNVSDTEIFADSAEPKSIAEISNKGYNIKGARKGEGSIEAGLSGLKSYTINIVNSPSIKKEFKSYSYKKDKEGILTNKPIDAFNHAIDAIRYWYIEAVANIEEDFFCEVI